MQAKTKYAVALVVLTLIVFALRLVVSFQVAEPSYESYFALVQADSIRENGLPRYDDPFSYQGRRFAFDPGFHYVIAAATLLVPEQLAVKILPNLFMALLVPLVYLIGHNLTKNRPVSLLTSLFAGLSPALFITGINEATSMSLALPVMAALLLALLDLEQHPRRALLLTAALTLLSPLIWLVLLAELVYLLILAAERLNITLAHLEIAFVTLLMAAWYTLITYKEALYRHGFAILSESLPATVRAATFEQFTLLAMLYAVGIVPLALGAFALYYSTFEQRNRKVLFVASLGLVALLMAVVQQLPLEPALILLSLVFVILAAPGSSAVLRYFRQTRFNSVNAALVTIVVLFFLLTSLLPALVQGIYPGSSPTPDELAAAEWLGTTSEDSVILAAPRNGFLLNHVAQRQYVADEAYLLSTNPDEILSDIDTIYTTPGKVAATELAEKYQASHILVGPVENDQYDQIGIILEDECFPRLYQNSRVIVLGVACRTEVGS